MYPIVSPTSSTTRSTATSSRLSSQTTPGIFYDENSDPEEECPDEDECEINWDLMPGYSETDDNDTDNETENKQKEGL